MKPLSVEVLSQMKRYRPFPDSAIREVGQWAQSQTWKEMYDIECQNKKAEHFEKLFLNKVDQLFPQICLKLSIDDNQQLLNLDRKRKREYNKNKKS